MISHHVKARWRHERANSRQEIERLELERDGAVFPRLLEDVAELAARVFFEALLCDRRTADVRIPVNLGTESARTWALVPDTRAPIGAKRRIL